MYQQIVNNESDLKLYRADKRKRFNLPPSVNSRNWEFSPSISGPWVLFGRDDDESNVKRLILYNRSSHRLRVLATLNGEDNNLYPGQVNGKWSVWTTCSPSACNVFRYDSSARTKTKLEKPAGPTNAAQYAAAVLRNGVVYAARSETACGATVRLVRFRSDDPSTGTELAPLPAGMDLSHGFARTRPDRSVDYLYDRGNCATGATDLYRVNDPPPP